MTEKFVTLPRDVVELALNAFVKLQADDDVGLASWDFAEAGNACFALRAALDRPQNHVPNAGNMVPAGWKLVPSDATHQWAENLADRGMRISSLASAISDMLAAAPKPPTVKDSLTVEQPQDHVPDAGNMAPSGWRIVPVEPTHEIISAMLESEAQDDEGKFPTLFDLLDFSGANKALMVVAAAYRAMLDAAPQPPTVNESLTVEQPQGEQEPMAWVWFDANERPCSVTFGGPNINTPKDWGVSPLYTHPQNLRCKSNQARLATLWGYVKEQPKREPLTDNQIDKIAESMPGGLEGFLKGWGWRQFARAVLENDHNIK